MSGDARGGPDALAVAAGTLVVGGILTLIWPARAGDVLRLVLGALAVAAALHALGANVPVGGVDGWVRSPFGRRRATAPAPRSDETARLRARLLGRRQAVPGGPWLPPDTLRLLRPLIAAAIRRRGMTGPPSPATRGVLQTEPLAFPDWRLTRRADPRRTAEAVLALLDDLDRPDAADARRAAPTPNDRGAR